MEREQFDELLEMTERYLHQIKDDGTTHLNLSSKELFDEKDDLFAPSVDYSALGEPKLAKTLDELRDLIGDCQRCKELAADRLNLVFGVGDENADIVFIGEAPGVEEDKRGEPFVGRAGQLLTKIISAMSYARRDVYIMNVLKCRPPGNRDPLPDEVAHCREHMLDQLRIIRPKVIVALGRHASQTLLETATPISRLRGRFFDFCGIPLMPTFHPSYLLRSPAGKRYVWDDMKKVLKLLGRDAPK